MVYFYLVPKEFLTISIVIEVLFALILLSVALFSLKVYYISKQRETKLFGISFFLIALSYIMLACIHITILSETITAIAQSITPNLARLGVVGISAQILLFLSGLVTLAYTKLRIKSGKIYFLLMGLSLITLITPFIIVTLLYNPIEFRSLQTLLLTLRVLAIFILIFILYNYIEECLRNKNKKTLMITIAFSLLLVSNAEFMFSLAYYQAYIIGHILEFIAYLFILISLILTVRK